MKLLLGGLPKQISFPVCLECKFRENECLLIQDKICLGPITQAGCDAICIAEGKHCYGCYGPFAGANIEAMKERLSHFLTDSQIKSHFNLFLRATSEYQGIYK